MNLMVPGVMQGLVGASSFAKLADASMSVYQQARARHDEGTAVRSLGYAATCAGSAAESSAKAQEALRKAQLEARERAEDEQETQKQTTNTPTPADAVEISRGGQAIADGKTNGGGVHSTEPAADAVEGLVVYTSQARAAPTAVQPRLSVIA